MPRTDSITGLTRKNIADELTIAALNLFGRLNEVEFLGRLFDLKTLPSHDHRYKDMDGDVWKHMVVNRDWDDGWFWTDGRLGIHHGPDDLFLRLLAEMLHPIVRGDDGQAEAILAIVNKHLAADGWEIAEVSRVSGRPLYGGRRPVEAAGGVAAAKEIAFDLGRYVSQQITRMEDAIRKDPELAIGTAKEFIETVCRTILKERGIELPSDDDLPALVKTTVKSLAVVPDGIANNSEAEKTIIILVNNLASMGRSLAELRNEFGSGHGKDAGHQGLESHHARLARSRDNCGRVPV
jgi:hypothetical protein